MTTQEEAELRAVVAAIGAKFGPDYFTRISESGQKATELWDALADGGFLGVNLPEEYGGGGMGLTALSIVSEELAAAGCPLIMLIISPAIAGSVLARHGSPEQKDLWLRMIATATGKVAFAVTEPDAGSNSHQIATSARRDGDGFIINGQKVFISALDEAAGLLVVARTGTDEATGRAQLSLFVVDADAPGITRRAMDMNLVMPDSQFSVFFDDVRVPASRMVGQEGRGLQAVFDGLNPERVIIASIAAGLGRYAVDKATRYANERVVWGRPIGAHQGLAHPLAEAYMHLEASRLMIRRACALYDAGEEAGAAANMAKFLAADAGFACMDQAVAVHGGSGFTKEVGLGGLMTLSRLFKTAPISREMILNFVSQHALGLPKSY
jgi:alkylation response protein AidB-like acyl-CoA dehydrogenase